MAKKTERRKLIEKIEEQMKIYIRRRDNDTCQRCGRKVYGVNSQTSHVIPRSHGNVLKYDDQNLKLLCWHCHLGWWHKNPLDASEWFKNKFPERWKYLNENKERIVKFSINDLRDILDKYLLLNSEE